MESKTQKKTVKKLLDNKKLPYENMRRISVPRISHGFLLNKFKGKKPTPKEKQPTPKEIFNSLKEGKLKPIEPSTRSQSKLLEFDDSEAKCYFILSDEKGFDSELTHIKTEYRKFVTSETKEEAEHQWGQLGAYKYGQLVTKLLLNPKGNRAHANKTNIAVKLVQEKIEDSKKLISPFKNKLRELKTKYHINDSDLEELNKALKIAKNSIYTLPLKQELLNSEMTNFLNDNAQTEIDRLQQSIDEKHEDKPKEPEPEPEEEHKEPDDVKSKLEGYIEHMTKMLADFRVLGKGVNTTIIANAKKALEKAENMLKQDTSNYSDIEHMIDELNKHIQTLENFARTKDFEKSVETRKTKIKEALKVKHTNGDSEIIRTIENNPLFKEKILGKTIDVRQSAIDDFKSDTDKLDSVDVDVNDKDYQKKAEEVVKEIKENINQEKNTKRKEVEDIDARLKELEKEQAELDENAKKKATEVMKKLEEHKDILVVKKYKALFDKLRSEKSNTFEKYMKFIKDAINDLEQYKQAEKHEKEQLANPNSELMIEAKTAEEPKEPEPEEEHKEDKPKESQPKKPKSLTTEYLREIRSNANKNGVKNLPKITENVASLVRAYIKSNRAEFNKNLTSETKKYGVTIDSEKIRNLFKLIDEIFVSVKQPIENEQNEKSKLIDVQVAENKQLAQEELDKLLYSMADDKTKSKYKAQFNVINRGYTDGKYKPEVVPGLYADLAEELKKIDKPKPTEQELMFRDASKNMKSDLPALNDEEIKKAATWFSQSEEHDKYLKQITNNLNEAVAEIKAHPDMKQTDKQKLIVDKFKDALGDKYSTQVSNAGYKFFKEFCKKRLAELGYTIEFKATGYIDKVHSPEAKKEEYREKKGQGGDMVGNINTFFSYDINEIYTIIERFVKKFTGIKLKLSEEAKSNIYSIIENEVKFLRDMKHGLEDAQKISKSMDVLCTEIDNYIESRKKRSVIGKSNLSDDDKLKYLKKFHLSSVGKYKLERELVRSLSKYP